MKLPRLSRALLALSLITACSEPTQAPPAEEVLLMRERAAAWFGEDRFEDARRELAPLVAGDDALAEDLLRAAQVEFAANQADAAGASATVIATLLARAGGLASDTLPVLARLAVRT